MKTIYNDPLSREFVTEPWVYWDNFFTEEELEAIADYCSKLKVEQGKTFTAVNTDVRDSNVSFIFRDSKSASVFDKFNDVINCVNEQYYNFKLNGYDAIQYTTYDQTGQHYDWHMDTMLGKKNIDSNDVRTRKLSLTMLLNDDFKGGEFQINTGTEAETIPTKKGRAILFPSFLIHRVTPVTSGIRKSLVIWVTGPKFS